MQRLKSSSMGKDKENGASGGESKDGAKAENLQLSEELGRLEASYAEVREVFQGLDHEYEASKRGIPMARYQKLKKMVKRATDPVFLDSLNAYVTREKAGGSGGAEGGAAAHRKSGKGLGGLLQKCKDFAGGGSKTPREMELSKMTKQEILKDNESKRREIDKYQTRFLRAYNRLDKLRRDYQASKGHMPDKRYEELKAMIKTVTSDKML